MLNVRLWWGAVSWAGSQVFVKARCAVCRGEKAGKQVGEYFFGGKP